MPLVVASERTQSSTQVRRSSHDRGDDESITNAKQEPKTTNEPASRFPRAGEAQKGSILVGGRARGRKQYRLASVIGRGANSVVYAAVELASLCRVAVKVVNLKQASKSDRAALRREIELLHLVRSDHVVSLLDVCSTRNHNATTDSMVALVFEHASHDLFEELSRFGSLSESAARHFFSQTCRAVLAMHSQRVVHGDIKLENVLVTSDGDARLCDFGFAVRLRSDEWGLQRLCGSQHYVSPEILRSTTTPYNPFAADIWGLGVLLHCLVTGDLPFFVDHGEAPSDDVEAQNRVLFRKILRGQRPALSSKLSPQLADLIDKMLTIDWRTRPTIFDVLEHPWLHA